MKDTEICRIQTNDKKMKLRNQLTDMVNGTGTELAEEFLGSQSFQVVNKERPEM